jgi:hypothetical protein
MFSKRETSPRLIVCFIGFLRWFGRGGDGQQRGVVAAMERNPHARLKWKVTEIAARPPDGQRESQK